MDGELLGKLQAERRKVERLEGQLKNAEDRAKADRGFVDALGAELRRSDCTESLLPLKLWADTWEDGRLRVFVAAATDHGYWRADVSGSGLGPDGMRAPLLDAMASIANMRKANLGATQKT